MFTFYEVYDFSRSAKCQFTGTHGDRPCKDSEMLPGMDLIPSRISAIHIRDAGVRGLKLFQRPGKFVSISQSSLNIGGSMTPLRVATSMSEDCRYRLLGECVEATLANRGHNHHADRADGLVKRRRIISMSFMSKTSGHPQNRSSSKTILYGAVDARDSEIAVVIT
jgi:hypothetical protein